MLMARIGDAARPEKELVLRARGGDPAAFEELVRVYEPELLHLALHMLGDHGEAQDATQDGLVLAWSSFATLAEPEAFRTWIRLIVTRRCLNVLRSRARRRTDLAARAPAEEVQPTTVGPEVEDPAAAALTLAELRRLQQVLSTLPADQRDCWVLKELHGMSYPEISARVGVPTSTVRGRLARARQLLTAGMHDWR